ncbi:MAG: NADH-quinone oxidoreductase subunit NuoK [Acidobacteriota bacterium]
MIGAATVPTSHVLAVAAALVAIGTFGVLLRRNLVFMLLALEIVLNGAALAFIGAAARWQQADGQVFALFIMVMAAAEVAVALALILQIYRQASTLDADALDTLQG